MGIISDFFIADRSAAPNYRGGEAFHDLDKCQFKGVTPLQVGQFLAVLRETEYTVDIVSEFELLTPEDAEDWTMSVPPDFANALANLEASEIPTLAGKFASATAMELGWGADDYVSIISDLSRLARRALETGTAMYLWNSL